MLRVLLSLLALASVPPAWADPPKLEIPPEVKPNGQFVELVPEGDAVSVAYVGLSGVDPLPNRWFTSKTLFLLPVRGLADGTYRFAAVGAGKTGEQTRKDFAVVVGKGGTLPPPTDPPTDPPTQPGGHYFMIVRPDGPASAELTRVLGLPAWEELRAKGFRYGEVTVSEAAQVMKYTPRPGTDLPIVVTLRVGDGPSKVVGLPKPLPATNEAVAALAAGLQ